MREINQKSNDAGSEGVQNNNQHNLIVGRRKTKGQTGNGTDTQGSDISMHLGK